MEIIELTNHEKIIELVDKFGGEPLGLERVNKTWVALKNNEEVGISGFVKINNDCWVLDPMAVKEEYRNNGIEEELINLVINYARENKIKTLYNMTKYIKAHEKCGFEKINENELPENVRNLIVCFSCKKRNVDCFPQLMKLNLG